MKKIIALFLAMMLSVSMLSGCGSEENEQETQQQTQQNTEASTEGNLVSTDCKGQVLTWNLGIDSSTLDPAHTVSADSKSVVNNTFEGLMRTNGDEVQPAMAADMPQKTVNEDGTVTLIYTLRESSWSDGQPVEAQDFEFARKRCADPQTKAENAYQLSALLNYDQIAQGTKEADELGVKALDDKTLEITLKQPAEYFNKMLGEPAFMPLREDLVSGDEAWSKNPQKAVSNGPFALAGYTEGKEFVLAKNKNYWNQEQVALDYIVARMLDENFAPVGMAFGDVVLTQGEIAQPENQTDTEGNTVEVPKLADTISAEQTPSGRVVNLVVNANTGNKLLQNKDVRNALSAALDRTAAAQAAGGEALLSVSGMGGEMLSASADAEQAKSVIESAADEENKIEIVYLENEQTAAALEAVKSAWKALGLTVTLTPQDTQTFQMSRNSLQYADVLCSVWEADVADRELYLQPYLSSNTQSGCGYTNPEFDKAMMEAIQAKSEERNEKFAQAEQILLDDAYVMPLYREVLTTTSDTAKVSGWSVSPDGTYWFGNATLSEK